MELRTVVCPFKPVHVIPLGDIQWAGREHFSVACGHLKEYVARGLELGARGDTVLFLGMGDYIDFMSPSNRARKEGADFYDTALDVIDKAALDLVNELYEDVLAPTRGKWLGLVAGHHFSKLSDGTTSDMNLCRKLKASFLGDSALIRLVFTEGQRHTTKGVLWVHHGAGNGQTAYYPIARLQKVAEDWEDVDVFLMGHTTKQALGYRSRVRPRWGMRGHSNLTHRTVRLVGTGGWSKTYVEHARRGGRPEGGYAEKKMLGAAVLGSPIVHLRPRRYDGGNITLDITTEG